MEPLRIINSQKDGPYAVQTCLGWLVNGPLSGNSSTDVQGRPSVSSNRISVAKLDELLKEQYKNDFPEQAYDEKPELSFEDQRFLEIVNNFVVKQDGHYQICLPFPKFDITLPDNKKTAEQRALSILKRFRKDEAFLSDYRDFIGDILKKGHAKKVPEEELDRNDGREWYIPHHGVCHKRKKKIRVVFDFAASFQGTSLNSELLQGPDLTNTLLGVILRFQQEPIAVMADIEGMFHQVKVPEEFLDFLRFLWWPNGDISQLLEEFRMTVHLFGAVSSPSCANFALRKTADDNEGKVDPEVLSTICNNFYVDDCLKSVSNEKQAIMLVQELIAVCATGGFKLTKWVSNSRNVLASIPEEERSKKVRHLDLHRDELPMDSALGLQWDT
ncbi:Arginine--tRNA ligase [Labeo rohita]|uniref:Arginine--tRNA ligase n=1 Tax=Labeo rohita TaxID=84645 RepID=A0ABQ8L957_LABRO|nr:Arginine--tRNA ligase [Labeo rohita]